MERQTKKVKKEMKSENKNSMMHLAQVVFQSISNASWKKIMKVYFVSVFFLATGIAFLFAYTAARDNEIVKNAAEKLSKERQEESLRDMIVTPKVQEDLYELVHLLDADRAFVFELHNGKKNTSGLPFRFADMTYEEVNDARKGFRVAMNFQDIPLTLYKYPHYLQREKMFIGSVDEIAKIDNEFAEHIRSIGGEYLAMIYMSSKGLPIGFLCVSFHDSDEVPDNKFIESKLREYDRLISNMLDLSTYKDGQITEVSEYGKDN